MLKLPQRKAVKQMFEPYILESSLDAIRFVSWNKVDKFRAVLSMAYLNSAWNIRLNEHELLVTHNSLRTRVWCLC